MSFSSQQPTDDGTTQRQFGDWTRRLRMVTGLGLQNDQERQEFLVSRCESWRDNLVETSLSFTFFFVHEFLSGHVSSIYHLIVRN